MPIVRGFDNKGCFYRYGETGEKYHYKCGDESARQRAYGKAMEQEIAIISSGYSGGIINYKSLTSPILMKKWRSNVTSSNVDRLMYNDENRELVIKFNDGAYYTYYDIDFTDFVSVFEGYGICKTTGSNRYGTWYIGKFPSVGAAVYDILVKSGKKYSRGGSLK